jgi:putative membrane protein
MKITAVLLTALFLTGCERPANHSQDNNPAEGVATEGEKDKDNSESNAEALADNQSEPLSQSDQTFVKEAADAGLTEVRMGELAQKQAASASVKEFSSMMIKDHNAANEELRNFGAKNGITLPTDLCSDCRRKYNGLVEYKGAAFDKKYMEQMVADHRDVVLRFERQSKDGNNKELKDWARTKLQTLKHHLSMAEDVAQKSGIANR